MPRERTLHSSKRPLAHRIQIKTRRQRSGGKGRRDIRVTKRNGEVVAALSVADDDQLMLISEQGMFVRSHVSEVRQTGRATQGVRVIGLRDEDRLVATARIAENGVEPAGAASDES